MSNAKRGPALCLAGVLVVGGAAGAAQAADVAADYPKRSVRFIIPFVPGAGTDVTTRTIARKLTETHGQQFIADNRAGAAGAIGAEITARANPDGYTLCLISSGHTVLAATNDKVPYDLVRDLHAVSQVSTLFYVLAVHPSFPAKTVKELIAFAKASPGRVNQGSSGTGALQHFAGEMLAHQAGVRFTHVPYKGGAASLAAVMSGEVEMSFTTLLSARPHMASGKIRVLGITAGKRSPAIPDIPTIAEAGVPGFEASQWYGLVAPAGTPKDIVAKMNAEIAKAMNDKQVAETLDRDGAESWTMSSDAFRAHIAKEIPRWAEIVQKANIRIN